MSKRPINPWTIITGATSGIGLAIAQKLSVAGRKLIIMARNESRLSRLSHAIHRAGGTVEWFKADLTCTHDLNQFGDWLKSKQMQIEAVVLSAGIAKVGNALSMPLADWRQILETNLLAPVALLQTVNEFLQPHARIIFINSVAGKITFPQWGAYAASKFALRALAQTLRQELALKKIHVTSIFPSSVNTPLHDSLNLNWDRQKMLQPEDVARSVEWLLNTPNHININELDVENLEGLF